MSNASINSKPSTTSSVVNFGCRLNAYEGEAIRQIITKESIENVVVVNTCAVTKEAERQARQEIRKIKRNNKDVKIVVTGCAAQVNPEQFLAMPEVHSIVGNAHKLDSEIMLKSIADRSPIASASSDIVNINSLIAEPIITPIEKEWQITDTTITSYEDRTRAFVQIQNGCDHRCTYCIIPYGRGKSRSVDPQKVIAEARALHANGYNELVLTGVDMTDYGSNLAVTIKLGTLCKMILKEIPTLPRLRLSSIDVAEIDGDLMDLIKYEPRFMPYLHISLQSGDNLILKRMKRRHNREDVLKFCDEVRKYRPELGFGSDIIAGFPTENDEMFANTASLLKEADIVYNHIFTYSERYNTPASRMPQIDKKIRKERTRLLIDQTKSQLTNFYRKMVGTQQRVIMELNRMGRTENFAPVKLINDIISDMPAKSEKTDNLQGSIITVKIIDSDENYLYGKLD